MHDVCVARVCQPRHPLRIAGLTVPPTHTTRTAWRHPIFVYTNLIMPLAVLQVLLAGGANVDLQEIVRNLCFGVLQQGHTCVVW